MLVGDANLMDRFYVSLWRNTNMVFASEQFESGERDTFRTLVKQREPRVFFDIGANVGLYSWETLSIRPSTRVVLFEPDRRNVKLLRRTLNRWPHCRATLFEGVVSEFVGERSFAIDDVTGMTGTIIVRNTFNQRHYGQKSELMTVTSTTIDAASQSFGAPDLIKIDVETGEWEVLRGALDTLSRHRPALFMECVREKARIGALLKEHGYTLHEADGLREIDEPSLQTVALPG